MGPHSNCRDYRARQRLRNGAIAIAIAAISLMADAALAGDRVRIPGNHAAEAAQFASGAEINPSRTLHMRLTMALRNRAELEQLLAAQQDPLSPQYHQWLTPEEFKNRFGPTDADVAKVAGWLKSQGFTVEDANAALGTIAFAAPAATAETSFRVHIATQSGGASYANLEDPELPADIAPMVASIHGLGNTTHAVPVADGASIGSPDVKIGTLRAFGPNDLATFYDASPLFNSGVDGTGADCIALVENSDFDIASVDAFDSTFGLPTINVQTVEADNVAPGINADVVEVLLDIQYAHAAAPGAAIRVYVGNDATTNGNGLPDAIARAVSDNACGVISISYSFCGAPSTFYSQTLDGMFAQAASQGQGVFASSGDQGAAGLTLNAAQNACVVGPTRNVSELSADPNVTAVGGTQFNPAYNKAGNDNGRKPEHAWHDGAFPRNAPKGAGGGGQSAVFAKPSFQSGVITTDLNRDVPDVAFGASPYRPGYFFGYQGRVRCCIGGTSLSAPYWAGIATLAEQEANGRTGSLNAKLYTLGAQNNPTVTGIRDVKGGNNSFNKVKGFVASKGYDRVTGWGTPDIATIVPQLAQ